jgi:non-ribosomal peptide synthetase component F
MVVLNATAHERHGPTTLPELVSRTGNAFPDRIAVKSFNRSMSYRDLDVAANRVAQAILKERDDRPEPVAFVVEHGPDAIVMLLGALKAGKFYVPLDASHPQNRLRAIIRHAQPSLILTNGINRPLAAAIGEGACAILDCDALDATVDVAQRRLRNGLRPKRDSTAEVNCSAFGQSSAPVPRCQDNRKVSSCAEAPLVGMRT